MPSDPTPPVTPVPAPDRGGQSPLDDWLAGPLGRHLLAAEALEVARALEQVFGPQFLQIGQWGAPEAFLPLARTQHRALLAEPGGSGDGIGHAAALPVRNHVVDAVLLPHTLEFEPEPHAVIREVDRVLVGEGHLLVLGFEPAGSWALRHLLSRRGFPPGALQFLPRQRLRDWLTLLGFEVLESRRFLHDLPVARLAAGRLTAGLARVGHACGDVTANVYLIKARKRLYTLTPIRHRRGAPKLAGAVVETI